VKLTEAQIATLHLIAAGKVRNRKFSHREWRIVGAKPVAVGRITSTLRLANWGPSFRGEQIAMLNEAGLTALRLASPADDGGERG